MRFSGRVRFFRKKTDWGRALGFEEEEELLRTILKSMSAVLHPLFILSLDAGLRRLESRALRRRDLKLGCQDGATVEGEIVVLRSKT